MCGYSPTESSRRYRVRCDSLPLTMSLCLSLYSLRRSVPGDREPISIYTFKKVARWCGVRAFVWSSGHPYPRFIQFVLGSFYAVHTPVLRKEEHACSINTIPYDSLKNSDFIHVYLC